MQRFTKNELDAKSIFEMRSLAKDVGVSAPTKLNKAELVELVYKITNGEMQPPTAPRRGRPKKSEEGAKVVTDLATEATKEEERAQKSDSEDDSEQIYQKPKFQPVVFRPTNSQFQKPQNNRQSYKENILNERKESIDEGAEQ